MAPPTKMMVMLPLLYFARKLDAEDPNIVFMLRCSYFSVQFFIALAVIYTFLAAQKLAQSKFKDVLIYVAPAPQPFAPPDAKVQYKQIKFGEHMASTARSLLTSTLFGIAVTSGLHFYKGMIVGICMQSIMGPLNIYENKLVMTILFGGSIKDGETPKSKNYFGEKYREDLTKDDEIVDAEGNIITLKKKDLAAAPASTAKELSFEDLLLDTWDAGEKADVNPLVKAFTKSNANYKTSESNWTPLMILAALGAPGCDTAIKKLKDLGVNASASDAEGWNALHWAAFHGSASGASILFDVFGAKAGLQDVKDKEGKTPLEHAVAEGNKDVVKVIEEATTVTADAGIADQDGIRKRK